MWPEMIFDKNLLPNSSVNQTKRLINEANELTSILIAARKTINTRNISQIKHNHKSQIKTPSSFLKRVF